MEFLFLVTDIYDLPSGLTQDNLPIRSHSPSSGRYQFGHVFRMTSSLTELFPKREMQHQQWDLTGQLPTVIS